MVDRFLHGIVFGAGFGISFGLVVLLFSLIISFPPGLVRTDFFSSSETVSGTDQADSDSSAIQTLQVTDTQTIKEPSEKEPSGSETQRGTFLGRMKIYSGGTGSDSKDGTSGKGIISSGSGLIVGQVIANNAPVAGLKLKLSFNGGVSTPWITTAEDGSYRINVPYAEYRVDGYELDQESANTLLSGMIDHPQIAPLSDTAIMVREGLNSRGPTFRFVTPINKRIPKRTFTTRENIPIEWDPYPGAKLYTLQIYERKNTTKGPAKEMFSRASRPSMTDTYINLTTRDAEFKPGYVYTVEIIARDDRINIVSKSISSGSSFDFEIVN